MNRRRVSVGFQGGQVLELRFADEKLEAFRQAVQRGGGWHEVEAEDGPILLNLGQVVFLRVDTEDQRIGF